MKMKSLIVVLLLQLVIAPELLYGQESQNTKLTVEKIMQDPEVWMGSLPDRVFWAEEAEAFYFEWNPGNKPVKDLFRVEPDEKKPKKLTDEARQELIPRSAAINRDKTQKVYIKNNGLYLYDIQTKNSDLLLKTKQNINSPQFTFQGDGITFMLDNDFYKWDLERNDLTQLADFEMKASPRKKAGKSKKDEWLHNQQMELFEMLTRKQVEKNYKDSLRKAFGGKTSRTIYTNGGFVSNVQLSPDENFITYNIYKRTNQNTKVPHYVSESGYLEIEDARAKVGGVPYEYELFIYNLNNDSIISLQTEEIPGIKEQPEYLKEYKEEVDESKPREVYAFGPYWSENGKNAMISVRSADNKDRWIMLLDPSTGKPELLDRQRDEAWIAGPGISRSGWGEDLGWLPDNEHVWFQSEESGYSHIHIVNIDSKKEKQLTKGKFEIYNPRISNDKTRWYFSANKVHPGERHFYSMPLMGGKPKRLTFMKGRNDVVLSPDEKYMVIRYSFSNQPWELYLKENKPEAQPQKITNSLTEAFEAYPWKIPEIITFKADDGARVHARLYKPNNKTGNKTPAVIFVHGAGYMQNVHKWWSRYFREYMFHNLLVDKGYTVLDIDYRGSAGYGRDWRTGIYRHMGGKDLSDHIDGAEFLIKEHQVDPNKIGIYGGSYGGFITLMGLFKHPEVFSAGAALRAVTDWAHYNHSYTSAILNEPTTDSIAYTRSSPIYFAEGLNDPLLICHGMIDDNVQFQDVVRLTQKLIEMGKEDWELAVYPLERHGFTEPESWTDEYKRILKLFEENLKD